jgi:HD-GYP domain-containing protein (c-di-GMP phosphodiesterase class II)
MVETKDKYSELITTLSEIGVALSAEKDPSKLLKLILSSAMELTNADGGTLYLVEKDKELTYAIIANKTLGIMPASVAETALSLPSLPLYINGEPNLKNVACYCYHQNKSVNIEDAYNHQGFDFSGARQSDTKLGYRSKSFLTIPLRDHENTRIGVLQLINAIDNDTHEVIPFAEERVLVAESLASQAAITLTKEKLILAQKKLFEAFLQLIAKAIDEKSQYTSNHCKRVPVLTTMIANAMNTVTDGPLKDMQLSVEQLEELNIAAWLHDCGKIVTPEHVMDKATKLAALTDRIEVINERFEIIKRDIKIAYLEKQMTADTAIKQKLEIECSNKIAALNQDQAYLNLANTGGEFISEDDKKKIREIGTKNTYSNGKETKPLLSEDDIQNLSIARGTLNDAEREIIQNHVKITHAMLSSLPYPDYLKNVPAIAGSHHERMDGKGYPMGITKDKLSIQARIVAIADVFEALTSGDRPYKTAKSLKEVLGLMNEMKKAGHIDPDLYDLFINEKLYLEYAKKYLKPEQIDV